MCLILATSSIRIKRIELLMTRGILVSVGFTNTHDFFDPRPLDTFPPHPAPLPRPPTDPSGLPSAFPPSLRLSSSAPREALFLADTAVLSHQLVSRRGDVPTRWPREEASFLADAPPVGF